MRSIKRWNAPFAKRLAIVAAILIVAQTLVFAIERRVKHAVVAPLPFSVIDCPMQLGDWTGADEPLDERIFQALGASEQVLRRYVKSTGEMVSIHIATWDSYRGYTPHTPLVCLPGAGWSIRSQRSIDLAGAGVTARNAKALYCDRESEPLVALYWYRLGQD